MTPLEDSFYASPQLMLLNSFSHFLQRPLYALVLMENKKMACCETANKEV